MRFDSPALDVENRRGLTTDQRGLPRPIADPNLRITRIEKAGGDVWLGFNSVFGKTYRVETTDELPPVTWNVLTNDMPGTGGRFQALDAGAANLPQRYYRTVLLP